uniref:Uncharacterized protein n=1 Tax=Arundo donax TaxID=35708 RepID=A0A0A9H9Q7_ARUDO
MKWALFIKNTHRSPSEAYNVDFSSITLSRSLISPHTR